MDGWMLFCGFCNEYFALFLLSLLFSSRPFVIDGFRV